MTTPQPTWKDELEKVLLDVLPVSIRMVSKPMGRFSQADEETPTHDANATKRAKALAAITKLVEGLFPTPTLQDVIKAEMFPTSEEYEKMVWMLEWCQSQFLTALGGKE